MYYMSKEAQEMVANARNAQNPQGPYGYNYVSQDDDEYASKTYANVIRGEYQDYKERFAPYENQLMDYASRRDLLDQQLSRITANVNSAYGNQSLSAGNIMQQRYGLAQTAQERQSNTRQTSIQQALSTAHAKNNSRMTDYDQRMNIVTGGDTARQMAVNNAIGG